MGELVLSVNGKPYKVNAPEEETLLSVLRNRLNLTGTKYGCGEGQCGACTVLMDGTTNALMLDSRGVLRRGQRSRPSRAWNSDGKLTAGAAGISRRRRFSMRLLHLRNDHERDGPASRQQGAE